MVLALFITIPMLSCRAKPEEALIEEPEQKEVKEEVKQEEATEEEEEPAVEEEKISSNINMLSGLELSGNVQNTRPLAIMVQNSPQARPHSGLIKADIVFEAVAEAGVTRFVTLFSSYDAEIIGPVRSARIYFAEIARSFDPVYTFWGTYPGAYDVIKTMDMDVLDANSSAYVNHTTAGWRDSTRSNALEHTAFIDTYGIKEDAQLFGYSLQGGQSPMQFKVDAPYQERGDMSEITVDFSYDQYQAQFLYDIDSNQYLKLLAQEPHIDFETGQQLSLNNVIVLITDIDGPVSSSGHMVIRTTGSHQEGKAFYFMDGQLIEGTWGRKDIYSPFQFHDSEDNPVQFNRGQTWVCIVQSLDRVSY
ncbi:MAG: DUF3048 domain-containing protein [Actinomycetota bacterium]|nr:DUF3048 domain-containing protein [Actinomycetota bacterium]